MRRLLRWTFNTLAAASLLLCLATAGLWVRSYWACDQFDARQEQLDITRNYFFIGSYRGQFAGRHGWRNQTYSDWPLQPWEFSHIHTPDGWWLTTGFEFGSVHRSMQGTYIMKEWAAPAWSLVSAFAVLPAIFVFRQVRAVRRRRHRSRLGLCPACGYDLRASPDRCPECGASPHRGMIPPAETAR